MDLIITFPGGKRVDSTSKGFTVNTDQPVHAGGEGSAPTPFDLFLHSIGTCSGVYVVFFCEKRGIPYENIRIIQHIERNVETKMIGKITLTVELPSDFPMKYKKALLHTIDLCTVKRHLFDPPEFVLDAVAAE